MGKKVSIITVNWNGLEQLTKLVVSLQRHTKNDDYELIVVDNNSDDGSKEYLADLSEMCPNISVYFNPENTGWVGGINKGLELIDHETPYVMFVNNDIEVTTDDWLDTTLSHFYSDEDEVGMVGPVSNFTMGFQKREYNNDFPAHHKASFLVGWMLTCSRQALEKIASTVDKDMGLDNVNGLAMLDPVFGLGSSDDLDISMRMKKAGYKLIISRDVDVIHEGSASYKKKFGDKIYENGTEAADLYMKDVNDKLALLRKKWGNWEVNTTLNPASGTIAIPHMWHFPSQTVESLYQMNGAEGCKTCFIGGALVDEARNMAVRDMAGDYLMFIDADMAFPPNAFVQLKKHLERDDVDIVSGVCVRKRHPYRPTMFMRHPKFEERKKTKEKRYQEVVIWPDYLFEVDAVGTAFMLIKRKVFEAMKAPWFKSKVDISEDLGFCEEARDLGFRIWVDPTCIIGHVGPKAYDVNDYFANNQQEIQSVIQKAEEKNNDSVTKYDKSNEDKQATDPGAGPSDETEGQTTPDND